MISSPKEFQSKIKKILISEEEIRERIKTVATEISEEYNGKPLLLLSILNGSFVFMADFCRALTIPCELAFMRAKSYIGTNSGNDVKITMDITQDMSKYNVIIVEDIIDSGKTLSALVPMLRNRNPISIKVVTLLDKPDRREVNFEADISLFTIPDYFVIGYGLDYDEDFRNLPYIAEYQQ